MVACRNVGWLVTLGLLATLLVTSGCGCTDDSGLVLVDPPSFPSRTLTSQIGMEIEPIPFEVVATKKVDVLFLLDDSFDYGGVIDPQTDTRNKSQVTQAIFSQAVANLKNQLGVDYPGETFDIAFGVARFEDFGGPFAAAGDEQARPFILNQPILREDYAGFNGAFATALTRTAPGNGNGAQPDAQTAIEALYQIATGNGFDGNALSGTQESGNAGENLTMLAPGLSGDVPAVAAASFVNPRDDLAGGTLYDLGDTVASGNEGGVGWRPDSCRYVVLASNICTAAPFVTPIPATIDGINASTVPSPAFMCGTDAPGTGNNARAGEALPPVAPTGAATVQQTVTALIESRIEVLSIGCKAPPETTILPDPFKPNQPGAVSPNVAAIPAPALPSRDPYTYMSALAILTGALDTDAGNTFGFPLVYNLTTVYPNGGVPSNDVTEDLADRIGANPFIVPAPNPTVPLGYTYYDVTLAAQFPAAVTELQLVAATPLVPAQDPDGLYVAQAGLTQTVRVPIYVAGSVAPDPVRVAWTVLGNETDPDAEQQKTGTLGFNITSALSAAPNPNPTYAGVVPPTVTPVTGGLTLDLPDRSADPQNPPLGTTVLSAMVSGNSWFRDVTNGTPAGVSIETMAGPFNAGSALPFP